VPLLFNYAVFDTEQHGGAMCLPSATFSTTIEKVADQILVQIMKPTKFRNAHPLSIKRCAGLLRRNWHGHSVLPPVDTGCFVFIGGDYARYFGLVQGECLKNCASESVSERSVGDRLRDERVRLGLNQEDLAQAGAVNRNTQGSYERGARHPDTAYLRAVAGLGVDIVYVLTGQKALGEGLNATEARIIEQFRSITPFDQEAISRFLQAMADDAARHPK
jgi:transcriptional regulator with XRE-family HTH domain